MRKLALAVAILMMLCGGPGRASAQEDPPAVFVHTWVLKFHRLREGVPRYRLVHVSEGPFEPGAAEARKLEIGTRGLNIGVHYYPVHLVQLVETRQEPR